MFTQGNQESVYVFNVALSQVPLWWLCSVYVILLQYRDNTAG